MSNDGSGTPRITPEDIAAAERLRELEKETLEAKITRLQAEREIADLGRQAAQAAGETRKAAFFSNDQRLKELEHTKAVIDYQRQEIENAYKLAGALTAAQETRLQQLATEEEILATRVESARAIEVTEAQTKNLIKAFTGVGDEWKESFIGSFVVASQTAGGLEEKMLRMKEQFKETFTVANILGSGLQRVAFDTLRLAKEQDEAIAAFNKTTSTMGEYADQLTTIERANVHLGLSTGEAADAFGTLLTNVTAFPQATPALQAELATTAAQMQKLGVSTQLTAKTMEEAMLVLGMTERGAMDLTKELSGMAVEMNLPIEQVTENFNAAMPVLAKFGRDAPDIFKKVQVASRSLGVAVGDLLTTMGQFDTFSGAAEAAGSLNAILGGDLLNSSELLQANEAERLRMVRDSIAMSGRQFENMGRFEKQAVANALGIKDISTATKMLSGDMDKFGDALDASGLTKEETEARIQATQSIAEKLANTWRMFAISMRPIAEMLHDFMNGLYLINQQMHGFLPQIALGILSLIKIVPAIKGVTLSIAALKGALVGIGPIMAPLAAFALGRWIAGWSGIDPAHLKAIGAVLMGLAIAGAAAAVVFSGGVAGFTIAAGLGALGIGLASGASAAGEDADFDGLEGFQEGGPVKAGRPIMVGEGGSEVFVPGADGAIRRNEDFMRMPSAQAQQAPAASPQASRPRDMTVVIQLDKRELGRATIKAIEDVPGYNIRGALEYA